MVRVHSASMIHACRLGLAKIGVVPALINYNLRNNALVHTIKAAEAKAIIYGLELEQGP